MYISSMVVVGTTGKKWNHKLGTKKEEHQKESIGAWRKPWWTFQKLLGVFEG
jgi:hypothetical protein